MGLSVRVLLALALVVPTVTPALAQDERDIAEYIGAAIAAAEAELADLGARARDEGLLAFASSSRGLVEVELAEASRLAPLVRALRDAGIGPAEIEAVEGHLPGLWQAAVVLGDVLDEVVAAGPTAIEDWLRERFGHLQNDERAALYADRRERLEVELSGLRRSRELFASEEAGQERATGETDAEGERWCLEQGLGETLRAEDSERLLGTPIPPLETLPEWCREPLLEWLIATREAEG